VGSADNVTSLRPAVLPEPLVPPDCDLRGMEFMPLVIPRLIDSDLYALSTGDEFKAALTLWCKAWLQVPAASLPDDDRILARLSGAGPAWPTLKQMALRGFVKCRDGRLYHPVVAEHALESWARRLEHRDSTGNKSERQKRWRKRVAELSAQLRGRGIVPPKGASLDTLQALLRAAVDANSPMRDAVVDASRDAHVDGGETGKTVTATTTGTTTDTQPPYAVSDETASEGLGVAGEAGSPSRLPACPHEKLVELYHEILPMCPAVVDWTERRQGLLRARWREKALPKGKHRGYSTEPEGLAWWRKFFRYVSDSKFLTGRAEPSKDRPPFVADLEWLVRPTNFVRVIEGRYHEDGDG